MLRSSAARLVLTATMLTALALPAAAAAAAKAKGPAVWAHRGGSYVNGKATYPENTLPAFKAAAKAGFALELDMLLTKDGVPIVIHDGTLDRTTPCTGSVADRTYADIRDHCKSDVLGSPGGPLGTKARKTKATTPLPTFAQVLAIAKQAKVTIAPELKAFDATGGTAAAMAKAIKASKIPLRQVVVQSFFNQDLAAFRPLLPTVKTSQLTIPPAGGDQLAGLGIAIADKATYVSPQLTTEITAAWIADAHGKGALVAPYTPDTKAEILRAKQVGADAVITDDPYMARKALGGK